MWQTAAGGRKHFGANYVSHEMRVSLLLGLMVSLCAASVARIEAGESWLSDPASSRSTEANAVERIPLARLTAPAQESIRGVIDRPSFFRRLPTQSIDCDPELFTFLVRYPEVIVNIWDLMDITKVEIQRVAPYVFTGHDGAGTTSRCELLYGTADTHVYYGTGKYVGNMAPREINGRCVSVLHSSVATTPEGRSTITISMDIFLKLDNFGADLLTRTLGPLVGKTADYNFVESAKFIAQVSQVCERNPMAAQQLAQRLTKVDPTVRTRFAEIASRIAADTFKNNGGAEMAELIADPREPADNKGIRITSATAPAAQNSTASAQPAVADKIRSEPSASSSSRNGGMITPVKPPVILRR